jgi:hypothetical protein
MGMHAVHHIDPNFKHSHHAAYMPLPQHNARLAGASDALLFSLAFILINYL